MSVKSCVASEILS